MDRLSLARKTGTYDGSMVLGLFILQEMTEMASYSLIKRVLLVIAGTEENPGPGMCLTSSRADQICPVCTSGKVTTENKHPITVYGRMGQRTEHMVTYRCNNRNKSAPCRAGFGPGYIKTSTSTIYEADALSRDVLVSSDQTGFDVTYLHELALRMQKQHLTFESEAEVFNSFHSESLPMDVNNKRTMIDRRRITHAYFLYTYLELGARYGIDNYQVIEGGNLEETILKNKNAFKLKFEENWSVDHKCDVPGCTKVMVIDGGLTPHRSVCAAKLSTIKIFEKANISYLIGCPKMPINESKFCKEHKDCDTPIVGAKEISDKSKKQLRSHKKKESEHEAARDDDFFVIEEITQVRMEKDKKMYLVKWVGYPPNQSTWEPEEHIPSFIKKYYDNTGNIGKKLPAPQIKHTKTIGGVKHHYLKWSDSEGDWLSEDFFKIMNEDGELVDTNQTVCNTRKSRDKRVKRHTVGLLIGSYPCGIVVLVEELFGSEAISQVYGAVTDHLGKLREDNLEVLVYDDVCHLAGFAKNHVLLERNPTTEGFLKKTFAIDKFHFKNHIDPFCHSAYNPGEVEQLKNCNTVICEQLFKDINQYRNCKSKNESHFFLFFLYNLDLHNLYKEGRVCMVNPKSEFRKSQIPANVSLCYNPIPPSQTESLTNHQPQGSSIAAPFSCPLCQNGFETEAWLKRHLNEKHPETDPTNPRKCPMCEKTLCNDQRLKSHIRTHLTCKCCKLEFRLQEELVLHIEEEHSKPCVCPTCDKVLTTEQRLKSHIQTHLTCTICKKIFEREIEMITHKREHTTCNHCNVDQKTLAKLKKHGNCEAE